MSNLAEVVQSNPKSLKITEQTKPKGQEINGIINVPDLANGDEEFVSVSEQWERVDLCSIFLGVLLVNVATIQITYSSWTLKERILEIKYNNYKEIDITIGK